MQSINPESQPDNGNLTFNSLSSFHPGNFNPAILRPTFASRGQVREKPQVTDLEDLKKININPNATILNAIVMLKLTSQNSKTAS